MLQVLTNLQGKWYK